MRKSKIFVTGISRFEDRQIILDELKRLCEMYGFELTNNGAGYWETLFAIRDCDIVVASLNPNRGILVNGEAEFEIGAAAMAGKKVYGYYQDTDLSIINDVILSSATIIEGSLEDCLRVI